MWCWYDVWYECGLQANALWCGVMWCSAGEEKRERVERGKRRKSGKGKRKRMEGEKGEKGNKGKDTLYYIKKWRKGSYLYEFSRHSDFEV